jgi:hypothetical protein
MQYSRQDGSSPPQRTPPQHAVHQQYQQQQQPLPRPQQQGVCPAWRDHSHYGGYNPHNPHNPHNSHSGQTAARTSTAYPFDPVHHSSVASLPWPQSTQSSYQPWGPNGQTGHTPLPFASQYPTNANTNTTGVGSAGESGSSSGNGSNSGSGVGSSSMASQVQPSVAVHSQQAQRHDPYAPLHTLYQHPSQRFSTGSTMPIIDQPHQSQPSSHQQISFMAAEVPPSPLGANTRRNINLPVPNLSPLGQTARTSQPAQQQQSHASGSGGNTTMLSSDEAAFAGPSRPSLMPNRPAVSSTGAMHSNFPSARGNANTRLGELPPYYPQDDRRVFDGITAAGPNMPPTLENGQPQQDQRARRQPEPDPVTRRSDHSDWDSDDDIDEALDSEAFMAAEEHALREGRQIYGSVVRSEDMNEARIRAHQLIRGQMSNKRVASKGAIASLQSVAIDSLPKSEQSEDAVPLHCNFMIWLTHCVQHASSAITSLASGILKASTRRLFGCQNASISLVTTVSRSGSKSRIAVLTAEIKYLRSCCISYP